VKLKPSVKWSRDHPVALDISASGTLKMNDSEKGKWRRGRAGACSICYQSGAQRGCRDVVHEPWGDRKRPVHHYLAHPPCHSALDLRPYSRCAQLFTKGRIFRASRKGRQTERFRRKFIFG